MPMINEIVEMPSDQLQVGMFVLLPSGWFDHPFLRNNFRLKSKAQVDELIACNIKAVKIDLRKSKLDQGIKEKTLATDNSITVIDPRESADLPRWTPDNLVPAELSNALCDKSLAAEERAQIVYTHSRELMKRLLQSPTAANIKVCKKTISSVTDLILSDDKTATNMLMITYHDFYTYTHSVNVGVLSVMLSKAIFGNSDAHDMHELGAGFFLHDLGKVEVRPEVINKPGRLDETEMRHMRTHPYKGFKLLENSGELSEESKIIILQHHERSDGSGYPKSFVNHQIHPYAKICSIADVYDALTAERSYKKAMLPFDALMLMKQKMSNHFDGDLFSKFVKLMS